MTFDCRGLNRRQSVSKYVRSLCHIVFSRKLRLKPRANCRQTRGKPRATPVKLRAQALKKRGQEIQNLGRTAFFRGKRRQDGAKPRQDGAKPRQTAPNRAKQRQTAPNSAKQRRGKTAAKLRRDLLIRYSYLCKLVYSRQHPPYQHREIGVLSP